MLYWAALIAANIPVSVAVAWVLFGSPAAFLGAVRDWIAQSADDQPAHRPVDDDEDAFAWFKVLAFVIITAGVLYGEHLVLSRWFHLRP